MNKLVLCIFVFSFLLLPSLMAQPKQDHHLYFDSLAKRWDEAMPLGNGWLGALVWQRASNLRLSIDRIDLWDDRPMPEIDKLKFNWVIEKVKLNQYDSVQMRGDEPYEKYPAPTKIPGAAIEFDISRFGKVISNELDIRNGLNTIKFSNGAIVNNYIHATNLVGYFGFENIDASLIVLELVAPNYFTGKSGNTGSSVEGHSLERLGYAKGTITRTANSIRYHQPTWNGNYYEVLIRWQKVSSKHIIGQWTITRNAVAQLPILNLSLKEPTGWPTHIKWWNEYWQRSSVSIPDKLLERQYYLEMYKFGCVARSNTPPISLQAIWTADDGKLPPWKGDYHHDLNTQLSYWPGYTGNHLNLTAGYTNWLWKVKEVNMRWTKQYFGVNGLNVPGVTTISGREMGGWVQYSLSPTTAAWLAQHFYWQWRYSMDDKFLKEKCRIYFDEVERFLMNIRQRDEATGKYKMALSSSPEYNDNRITAWFKTFTNYDLSLTKAFYLQYKAVLDAVSGRNNKYIFFDSQLYPDLDTNNTGLTIARGQNLEQSHRHHAHLMAIHPLGYLDSDEEYAGALIKKSLRHLEKTGTREWCGYSFSWAACIYARAKEADNARKRLQIFATNFCSPNSFHLNGDQKGGEHSNFTYRPFTLEGNFAFAQGVHEMLIQSHRFFIEVFPAVPNDWKDVSFNSLRTEGALLISAKKIAGNVDEIIIKSEKGGEMNIKLPMKTWIVTGIDRNKVGVDGEQVATVFMKPGQTITFKNGYE